MDQILRVFTLFAAFLLVVPLVSAGCNLYYCSEPRNTNGFIQKNNDVEVIYPYKIEWVGSDYVKMKRDSRELDQGVNPSQYRATYVKMGNFAGYEQYITDGEKSERRYSLYQGAPSEPLGTVRSVNGGYRRTYHYASEARNFRQTSFGGTYSPIQSSPVRINEKYSNQANHYTFRSQAFPVYAYEKQRSLSIQDIQDINTAELRREEARISKQSPDTFYYRTTDRSTLYKNKYYDSPRQRLDNKNTIYYDIERVSYDSETKVK